MNFNEWLKSKAYNYSEAICSKIIEFKDKGFNPSYCYDFFAHEFESVNSVADIQFLYNSHHQYKLFEQKKDKILKELKELNLLDSHIEKRLLNCKSETVFDDVILPFKPQLFPIPLEQQIENNLLNDLKNRTLPEDDYQKARELSFNIDLRNLIRSTLHEQGSLVIQAVESETKKHPLVGRREKIAPLLQPKNSHKFLAVKRTLQQNKIKVDIQFGSYGLLAKRFLTTLQETHTDFDTEKAKLISQFSLDEITLPYLKNEILSQLNRNAEDVAINVFCRNLETLLISAPFPGKNILGMSFKDKRKVSLACIDHLGKTLESAEINISSKDSRDQATPIFLALLQKHSLEGIAIIKKSGSHSNNNFVETFVRNTLKEIKLQTPISLILDNGIQSYSKSPLAKKELPDLSPLHREAVAVARRMQDPLQELSKIKPFFLGVGQYQSDIQSKKLEVRLNQTLTAAVHKIGLNINKSHPLSLSKLIGINKDLANNICDFIQEKGGVINNLETLLNSEVLKEIPEDQKNLFIPYLKADGDSNPFHNSLTTISELAELKKAAKENKIKIDDGLREYPNLLEKLLSHVNFNEHQKNRITKSIKAPFDSRDEFNPILFDNTLRSFNDLKESKIYPGIISNITNFGLFVDVGINVDGLVPISEITFNKNVDPLTHFGLNHKVLVKVIRLNSAKKQISFSIRQTEENSADKMAQEKAQYEARKEEYRKQKLEREEQKQRRIDNFNRNRLQNRSQPQDNGSKDSSSPEKRSKAPMKKDASHYRIDPRFHSHLAENQKSNSSDSKKKFNPRRKSQNTRPQKSHKPRVQKTLSENPFAALGDLKINK